MRRTSLTRPSVARRSKSLVFEILNETFPYRWRFYHSSDDAAGNVNIREKIRNAYLLFYERIVPFDEKDENAASGNAVATGSNTAGGPNAEKALETEGLGKVDGGQIREAENAKENNEVLEDDSDEVKEAKRRVSRTGGEVSTELQTLPGMDEYGVNIPADFYQWLIEENKKYYLNRYLFGKEYFAFFTDLLTSEPDLPENDDYFEDIETMRYLPYSEKQRSLLLIEAGAIFFLTSIIRERERNSIIQFLPWLKRQLARVSVDCACLAY